MNKDLAATISRNRDIPIHEHTHSLYTHCLDCFMFGIDMPTRFIDASECGNCRSINTVKYYPSCCIVTDRDATQETIEQLSREREICVEALKKAPEHFQRCYESDFEYCDCPEGGIARQALSKLEGVK